MKAAIIGMGRMGAVHLDALFELGHDVVAVADTNLNAILETTRHLAKPLELFTSSADLFSSIKPELICIATTADSHATVLEEALALTGLSHIFCEKPFVTSLAEARRIDSLAQELGIKVGLNHQMRFMEQYQLVKEQVVSGRLGEFISMTVCAPNFGWANNCSHYIEAFLWLAESPISKCQAWLEQRLIGSKRGPKFFDHAGQALLWTRNRKRLYLDFASDLGQGLVCIYSFRNGRVVIDEGQRSFQISGREEGGDSIPTDEYGYKSWSEFANFDSYSLTRITAASIQALIKGENFPDSLRGIEIVGALVAGIQSSRNSSRVVDLEELQFLPIAEEIFPWA